MKKKCYYIMIAKVFPAYHPKAGEPTRFKEKILSGEKIHTIRENYTSWKKKIDEVNKGLAYLSLRQWEDKPYKSKQKEFLRLEQGQVGCEEIYADNGRIRIDGTHYGHFTFSDVIRHDGLDVWNFWEWFPNDSEFYFEHKCIIHFTDFLYKKNRISDVK